MRTCQKNGTFSGNYSFPTCENPGSASCQFDGKQVRSGAAVSAFANSSVKFGEKCISEIRTCENGVLSGAYLYPKCDVGTPSSCSFGQKTIPHGQPVVAYQSASVSQLGMCVSETRVCNNGALSGSFKSTSCNVAVQNAACTFNGGVVAHGQKVNAYQNSSVKFGKSCVSQSRICENGSLSGTFLFANCQVDKPASCEFDGKTIADGEKVAAFLTSTIPLGIVCPKQTRTCKNGQLSGNFPYSSCQVAAPASCLFEGQTIAHGQAVTAYELSSNKKVCLKQTRICSNGALSGSYRSGSCTAEPGRLSCSFGARTIPDGMTIEAFAGEQSANQNTACVSEKRTCSNGILSGTYSYSWCTKGFGKPCSVNGQIVALDGGTATVFKSSTVGPGEACVSETRTCSDGVLSAGKYSNPSCYAPDACYLGSKTIQPGQSILAYKDPIAENTSSCKATERTCSKGLLSGDYEYAFESCQEGAYPTNGAGERPYRDNDELIPQGRAYNAYQLESKRVGGEVLETFTCKPVRVAALSDYSFAPDVTNGPAKQVLNTIYQRTVFFRNYYKTCPASGGRACNINYFKSNGDFSGPSLQVPPGTTMEAPLFFNTKGTYSHMTPFICNENGAWVAKVGGFQYENGAQVQAWRRGWIYLPDKYMPDRFR